MVNIVFLGAPGSGKGTQALMLAKELNIPTISTGESLRKEVEMESEVGKAAKSYMDSGKLVPDDVVVNIIKNRITKSDCENGFIVDGFPRNIKQAAIFDEMLSSIGKKIEIVFDFEVTEDVLIKRISGRFSCKKCGSVYNHYFKPPVKLGVCDNCGSDQFESRSDDNEAVVINRLKVYHESGVELIGYYKKKNLLYSIDALKSVPFISKRLIEVVQER